MISIRLEDGDSDGCHCDCHEGSLMNEAYLDPFVNLVGAEG